jgi:hypothetical protein
MMLAGESKAVHRRLNRDDDQPKSRCPAQTAGS